MSIIIIALDIHTMYRKWIDRRTERNFHFRTDIFLTLSLPNLQKIFLSECKIGSVADHTFR